MHAAGSYRTYGGWVLGQNGRPAEWLGQNGRPAAWLGQNGRPAEWLGQNGRPEVWLGRLPECPSRIHTDEFRSGGH